jgi:N-acetylmuramoyl-L-alanine amidase
MGTRRELSQINTIVIHCADTPNGRANTIEDIDDWHRQRGFTRDLSINPKHQPHLKHVGYHFVIEIDGAVRPGRPLHETGAHVEGHNHNSLGICLIGRDQYTHEQWESLRTLVQSLLHPRNDLGMNLTAICGHRDLNPGKTCPGFDVADWLLSGYRPKPDNVLEQPQ